MSKTNRRTQRILRTTMACAVAVLLSGCFLTQAQRGAGFVRGAHHIKEPAQIGPNPGELKLSPCACITLKTDEYGQVTIPRS